MPAVDTTPIERETETVLVGVRGLAVTDAGSYEIAGAELVTLATTEHRIADWFRPLKDAAFRAHKVICDRERSVLTPLQREIARLKGQRVQWKGAEDRHRREEEQRLATLARQREADRLTAAAAELEQRGQTQQAVQVLERAIAAPAPAVVLPDATPRTAGISQRLVWRYRVVDEALIPREYLCRDDQKIGAYVRAMKSTGSIPGIEIYSEMDETVRRTNS